MKTRLICKAILTLLITSLMIACKKDEKIRNDNPIMETTTTPVSPTTTTTSSYKIIYPLDYFPVYPGSYWKYVDSDEDTTIIRTNSSYQKDSYQNQQAPKKSDTCLVPIYNNIPIWGYEAHTGPISHAGSYRLTRILSESLPVGSYWGIYSWGGINVTRKIIAKDTTITISNKPYYPTIIVEEYYSSLSVTNVWKATRYYTKHIGLVKEDLPKSGSTKITKEILDYYINK